MKKLEKLMEKYPTFREYCGEMKTQALEFSSKDYDNPNYQIRLAAYRTLGFTPKALTDPDVYIRREAHQYFYQKYKEQLCK